MEAFIVWAAALAMLGVAVVAVPLLRRTAGGALPAPWAAVGASVFLVLGAALLYATWSHWSWHPATTDSPEGMVARLARQLEREPQNLEGWLMLGHSYTVLQEYPLAVRAYERADRLSNGRSAEALTGEAEALALGDESELDGRAARLIEQALALDPASGKALFYGAAIAERHGKLPLARERFAKLLALNPPESVRPVIEQQIAAIDQKLAGGAGAGPVAGGAAAAAGAAPARKDAEALVRVSVSVAPALAAAATGAPLFVFVRGREGAGPPLAARKLEAHFPQDVALSPADAVVPGRAFAAGQSVQVIARIARSGNPVGASGDPYGEIDYQVGTDGRRNLVIDRVMP